MKRIFRLFIYVIVLIVLFIGGFLIYAKVTDYNPPEKTELASSFLPDTLSAKKEFCFMSWNIGYCGLGDDMDFFYDGGVKTRTSKTRTKTNLNNVIKFLSANDSLDFILLQEVDVNSKRSYRINEVENIGKKLRKFNYALAKNYDVKFVPVPVKSPLGKVVSGVVTFSKYLPFKATRYSLPGKASFPTSLFMLDRCFLVHRFPLKNGKEILIVNTHNAAYEDSLVKREQMRYMKTFLLSEYGKGNYVIVGGDWNQSPYGFNKNTFSKNIPEKDFQLIDIDKNYLPDGWKWLWDNSTPTNRFLNEAYNSNTTGKIILDFFLVSPNVEALSIKTFNLDFKFSDHNPVIAKVKLI